MEALEAFFAQKQQRDIHALAAYIQQHIYEQWEVSFQHTRQKMVDLYDQLGDSVYAIYGQHLFQPIHDQFKTLGFRAVPRLPGSLPISREWGDDDRDRQRWMWSKINAPDGTALGTIVTVFFHDHVEIRIPRAFQVIALAETSQGAVIRALSQLSADFKAAIDMKAEIAHYMQALEQESGES